MKNTFRSDKLNSKNKPIMKTRFNLRPYLEEEEEEEIQKTYVKNNFEKDGYKLGWDLDQTIIYYEVEGFISLNKGDTVELPNNGHEIGFMVEVKSKILNLTDVNNQYMEYTVDQP